MKNGKDRMAVFGVLLLAAAGGLWSADQYKVVNGPKDFYYGHVSYIEPGPEGAVPTVRRADKAAPEEALLNMPIGPGDTVRTTAERRVEIQFDSGTIVRLDFATEFRVETILARSLSKIDELSVMALERGRIYVQYREYDRKEMFQVLTPNAAVRMKHNSVATVAVAGDGSTEAQVKYGRADVRFGPEERSLDDRTINKGERLIVLKDNQSELAAAIEGTAFELWNNEVNANFRELHMGRSGLPKPLQKLPRAVFYFAQTYGNTYGEWLWDDVYGYVWRPFIDNGAYPTGWQPYYYGQWASYGSRMFWIPGEPWGWIPYHLGVWHWSKKIGWVWLPGSMFAPAWVTWDFYFGYACWRPWGLYDWMYDPYARFGFGGQPSGFYYGDGIWGYAPPGSGGGGSGHVPPGRGSGGPGPTVIRRDQLRQPQDPALPVPVELRAVLRSVRAAYNRGDARAREDAAEPSRHLVFVDKRDLGAPAIDRKALPWDKVPKAGPPADGAVGPPARRLADPQHEAMRILRGLDGPSAAPRQVPVPPASAAPPAAAAGPGGARPLPSPGSIRSEAGPARAASAAPRFRDWNPDLRVARSLGAHIEYSGAQNEVRCPELGFSSRDRVAAGGLVPHLTRSGIAYGPATSVGGGDADRSAAGSGTWGSSGSSASSGPSGASGAASTSGRGGETRSGGEAKGGGGEKIKK